MKKIIAFALMLVVLLSVFILPCSAVTKADLLAEAAKSPVYKYVKVAVENAARNIEITDEQAAQLLPLVQEGVALVSNDEGPTVVEINGSDYVYSEEQVNGALAIIDRACELLDLTYSFDDAALEKGEDYHAGDISVHVYDKDEKMVFKFDGDIIANTSAGADNGTAMWIAIAAAVVMTICAGAAFIAVKKRAISE